MGMEGKGWKWGVGDRGDVIEREHVHCRYKSYTSSDSYSTGGFRGGVGGTRPPPLKFSKISNYDNKAAPRPHAFEKKNPRPPNQNSWIHTCISSCYYYLQYHIFNHMIEKYSCSSVQLLIWIVDVLINMEQLVTGKAGEFKPTTATELWNDVSCMKPWKFLMSCTHETSSTCIVVFLQSCLIIPCSGGRGVELFT